MLATKEHCFLCFEVLENKLTNKSSHIVKDFLLSKGELPSFPLFVTWTKHQNLRGCIGCFNKLPLIEGLSEYALTAAMRDSRFKPIISSELSSLECEVSLLHSFEDCKDPLDWQIGVHGTTFYFEGRHSTFLPEVAEEWHWTKEQTLQELAQKAGIRKKITEQDYPKIRLERYQSSHIQATYEEYKQFVSSHQ